jgi:enhancing lycopene biosynthesis protein 2
MNGPSRNLCDLALHGGNCGIQSDVVLCGLKPQHFAVYEYGFEYVVGK